MKIAWIVGAGFSRSLGGPLLEDLISPARAERISAALRTRYKQPLRPGDADVDPMHTLTELLKYFNQLPQRMGWADKGVVPGKPWRDAEEFVSMLEATSGGDRAHQIVVADALHLTDLDLGDMRRHALLFLAAACHEFVPEASTAAAMERWEPYLRWADQLTEDDDVVSFNYDTVVETAVSAIGRSPHARLWKLHGSVDEFDGCTEKLSHAAIWSRLLEGQTPKIVVPGPDKGRASAGELSDRWKAAMDALTAADVVVMVGYRFAQTDQHAKRRLVEALERNKNQLTIRVVLGSDTRGPDAARVAGMLRWALRMRGGPKERGSALVFTGNRSGLRAPLATLQLEPLFAEDFMAVFDRACLSWTEI